MNEPMVNFCVKRLITEIQSRPALWDCRIKEYSDRALKKEAWDELCAAFVPHYYESSIGERNGLVASLQRKWKSVRDAYLRELKRSVAKPRPGMRFTKPYAYFDNLMFLRPVCEVKQRREDDETSFNNETVSYDENDDSDNNYFNENNSSKPTRKRRRTAETEDVVFNMLADHIKRKRKRDQDPDRQFLLSLLPDLKRLNPTLQFDLKFEIMSVIKRYKEENLSIVSNHRE